MQDVEPAESSKMTSIRERRQPCPNFLPSQFRRELVLDLCLVQIPFSDLIARSGEDLSFILCFWSYNWNFRNSVVVAGGDMLQLVSQSYFS